MMAALVALAAGGAVALWPAGRDPEWIPAWTRQGGGTGRGRLRRRPGRGRAAPHGASPAGLVPEALDLVALALLGGGSLAGAVTRAGGVLPGEPGRELVEVGARLQGGATGSQAWDGSGARWEPARRSLQLAEAAGVPPGEALTRSADDLRREAVADVEVAAARLGIRLVLPLGLAYLPAFVLTTVLPLVLALMRDLTW